MENKKGEMGGSLGKVMFKMLGIMGRDPTHLLTDDEINKLLVNAAEEILLIALS